MLFTKNSQKNFLLIHSSHALEIKLKLFVKMKLLIKLLLQPEQTHKLWLKLTKSVQILRTGLALCAQPKLCPLTPGFAKSQLLPTLHISASQESFSNTKSHQISSSDVLHLLFLIHALFSLRHKQEDKLVCLQGDNVSFSYICSSTASSGSDLGCAEPTQDSFAS